MSNMALDDAADALAGLGDVVFVSPYCGTGSDVITGHEYMSGSYSPMFKTANAAKDAADIDIKAVPTFTLALMRKLFSF